MEKQREYTRSEVATNNEKDKVLVILHDKVFNVHSFLSDHPGGEEVLLDHKGTDGSVDFNDVGHSQDAMNLMTKYQVGVLVESERTNKPPKKGWVAGYNTKQPEKEKYIQGPGKPFYLLAGGLLLLLFLMFYGY